MWARKPQVWLIVVTIIQVGRKIISIRTKWHRRWPHLQPRGPTSTIWGSTFCIKLWSNGLFSLEKNETLSTTAGDTYIIQISRKRPVVFIVLNFLIVITRSKHKGAGLDSNRIPHSSSSKLSCFQGFLRPLSIQSSVLSGPQTLWPNLRLLPALATHPLTW